MTPEPNCFLAIRARIENDALILYHLSSLLRWYAFCRQQRPQQMASADSPQTVSGGNSSLRDRIVTAARHWFRPPSGHDQRTEAQLESERWLLRRSGLGPRFERLHIVLPCVLIQACCGVIYSWSVFNAPMDENVWGTPGCNASAFLVSVAAYGASTVTFGAFVGRAGPFASVARTVLFTPLSWVLAAVASRIGSLWLLILGYGLCAGVGTAHGYLATTSAMQKWFPEKRGFASGVAVAGFGIGAFSASLLGKSLLDPKGPHRMSVPAVQGVFAGLLFSILLLSWPVLRLPPPGWAPPHAQAHSHPAAVPVEAAASAGEHAGTSIAAPAAVVALAPAAPAPAASGPAWLPSWLRRKPRDPSDDSVGPDRKYTLLSAIASFEFIALAVVVFGNSMPGVVALSSLADMTMYTFSMDAGTAGTIAALQNLINFSGRFSWGYISDLTGRRPFFVFASLAQVAAVAALPACIRAQNFPLWSLCMLTIASLYGGIFGSLPPAALELFGSDLAAATHGILIAQWALSAVVGIPIFTAVVAAHTVTVPAPSGVGTVRHATPEAYALNAQWLLVMPIVASIAALLLTTNRRDRILSKALRQLRVKCWRRTLVVSDMLHCVLRCVLHVFLACKRLFTDRMLSCFLAFLFADQAGE